MKAFALLFNPNLSDVASAWLRLEAVCIAVGGGFWGRVVVSRRGVYGFDPKRTSELNKLSPEFGKTDI